MIGQRPPGGDGTSFLERLEATTHPSRAWQDESDGWSGAAVPSGAEVDASILGACCELKALRLVEGRGIQTRSYALLAQKQTIMATSSSFGPNGSYSFSWLYGDSVPGRLCRHFFTVLVEMNCSRDGRGL